MGKYVNGLSPIFYFAGKWFLYSEKNNDFEMTVAYMKKCCCELTIK